MIKLQSANMARLEENPETFRLLGVREPSGYGVRRVRNLPLDRLRPTIRFVFECPVTDNQPEWINFDHELILFSDSRGEIVIGQQSYSFQGGSSFLIPPFTPHSIVYRHKGREPAKSVHFDMAPNFPNADEKLNRRIPYEVRLQGGFAFPVHLDASLEQMCVARMEELIREWKTATSLGYLAADVLLADILAKALLRGNRRVESTPRVSLRSQSGLHKVTAFLETHYGEAITLEQLAALAGLSVNHLIRTFRAEFGYAPMHYLNHVRMKAARSLLQISELSIKEIGSQVGFEDAGHFSRAFRRYDGLSPSQFRQNFIR